MKKTKLGLVIFMVALMSSSSVTIAAPIGGHCISNREAAASPFLRWIQFLQTRVYRQC